MAYTAPDNIADSTGKPVWVVVLHYQAARETIACLHSLEKLNFEHFRVLILDNGSPDQSGDEIAGLFPQFDYLRLPENRGFAGGCNAGVDYCVKNGAEWVWLLNNDTLVEAGCLSILMENARQNKQAALLGAQIYTPLGDTFVPEGAGELDFRRGKSLLRKKVDQNQGAQECEWLSGCNLLLRTEAFLSVGGFDEAYFLYFEDTDLCFRLRNAGWQCLLVPLARVDHLGGKSTEGKLTTWRAYYYTRNRLLFFMRYARGAACVAIAIGIAFHLTRHSLVLPLRGEKGKRQLKAELLGLKDYLSGKLGKAECLDW